MQQIAFSPVVFLTILFASSGFISMLVVGGIWVGSLNSRFVTVNNFSEHQAVILAKLDANNKSIIDLKLEFVRLKTRSEDRPKSASKS